METPDVAKEFLDILNSCISDRAAQDFEVMKSMKLAEVRYLNEVWHAQLQLIYICCMLSKCIYAR